MFKNLFLVILLALISTFAMGGSSGYVYEGRTYYIHKDGKELNETPMQRQVGRSPASIGTKKSNSMILYFTEDDYVRCYYWDKKARKRSRKKRDSNIHCLKLSELKERL